MNFQDFKNELYKMREDRQRTDEILTALRKLEQRKFDGVVNVTDTARDYIQRKFDTDEHLIDVISKTESKRRALCEDLAHINAEQTTERERIKKAIQRAEGVNVALVENFFIYGNNITEISKDINQSKGHTYELLKRGIKQCFDTYNATNERE